MFAELLKRHAEKKLRYLQAVLDFWLHVSLGLDCNHLSRAACKWSPLPEIVSVCLPCPAFIDVIYMWLYFSSDYTWVKRGNYLFTILYFYNCFLFICRDADRSDRSVFSNPIIPHPDQRGESVLIYWKKGPVLLGDGRYVGDLVTWSCRWPNGFAKIRRCTKLVVTSDGIKCWGHPDSGEASSTGRSEGTLNLCPNFLKVMHRIITHGIHLAGGDTLIPLDAQGQKSCKGTWALWWKLIFWYCLETWIEHAVATQHMLHWLLGSF